MDARYARGRTALVERRERFYRLGNPPAGHLAPLFPKTQFLKYTKRVSLGLFRWLARPVAEVVWRRTTTSLLGVAGWWRNRRGGRPRHISDRLDYLAK